MGISAEDFLKNHEKKKRSVLHPFLADILKLRKAGLSLADVQSFLLQNGVETSQANISAFLKRQSQNRRQQDLKREEIETSISKEDAEISGNIKETEHPRGQKNRADVEPAKAEREENPASPIREPERQSTEQGKKFEWPPKFTKDDWL